MEKNYRAVIINNMLGGISPKPNAFLLYELGGVDIREEVYRDTPFTIDHVENILVEDICVELHDVEVQFLSGVTEDQYDWELKRVRKGTDKEPTSGVTLLTPNEKAIAEMEKCILWYSEEADTYLVQGGDKFSFSLDGPSYRLLYGNKGGGLDPFTARMEELGFSYLTAAKLPLSNGGEYRVHLYQKGDREEEEIKTINSMRLGMGLMPIEDNPKGSSKLKLNPYDPSSSAIRGMKSCKLWYHQEEDAYYVQDGWVGSKGGSFRLFGSRGASARLSRTTIENLGFTEIHSELYKDPVNKMAWFEYYFKKMEESE